MMIYGMRWYGIKGETIEPGSKYEMSVIRVQTSKDGAWQALTEPELDQLLMEHNQAIANKPKAEKITFSSKALEKRVKAIPSPTKKQLVTLRGKKAKKK